MPPVLPSRDQEFINFCNEHLPIWQDSGAALGLNPTLLGAFETVTNNVTAAFTAAQAARSASRGATELLNARVTEAREVAADLVRTIKTFAENQPTPATVYQLAQIPAPSAPSPQPLPGKPTDLNVQLNPDGSITLSWAATNSAASSGAFFNVVRKLPGQTSFLPLGGAPGGTTESGRRMFFTDSTIPTSAAQSGAQYIIQGYRGTRAGEPSDTITVQFGVEGQGATVTGATLKMAA